MARSNYPLTVFLVAAFIIAGCSSNNPSSSGGTEPPMNVSFSSEVQQIFAAAGCAASSCHGATQSAGLELTDTVAYENIVNVSSTEVPSLKRVLPGDAQNSYLIMKLEGRQTVGERMPRLAPALSTHNIEIIRTWIDEGANDN